VNSHDPYLFGTIAGSGVEHGMFISPLFGMQDRDDVVARFLELGERREKR